MLAKFLKSVIVLAMALTFFGGTAMADRWGRDYHPQKRHHHVSKHYAKHCKRHGHVHRPHIVHRDYGHAAPARPHYRKPQYHASSLHPLAPRVVFIGGLPVPVPPPPHEVIDYLTGH